ncbi:MAG: hypothetical protein J6B68_01310 [Lachnospiraceae bacterium]|nr:hypothetical protein [Lachnospiraceae bacterium]MBO5207962.1 hypothetical protein [Lachnospiraceae bacterium]
MISSGGIKSAAAYYQNSMQAVKKNDSVAKAKETVSESKVANSSEDKLSTKAKNYLENLRKTYGDYDFYVADAGVDRRALLSGSTKEFSVIFSNEELERMADDEAYAQEKMHAVQIAVEMSKRINEQFGADLENGTLISKMAISFDEDGKMSIFAQLEKLSEAEKDYIEKIKEKRADEKKVAEELAEKKAQEKDMTVKKVNLEASSEEELIEKITNVDWSKVAGETEGIRFDFSV